jgi:mannose-6-phosphate isomerase
VHAYLHGTGVEIMASSDNVLRCGLTPKHVDVAELLKITDFSPLAEPRWPSAGGRFEVPVSDFSLTRLEVAEPTGLDVGEPCIVLTTSGKISLDDASVPPGHASFVPAGQAATLAGQGTAFIASVGFAHP